MLSNDLSIALLERGSIPHHSKGKDDLVLIVSSRSKIELLNRKFSTKIKSSSSSSDENRNR